jgi:hypothetical protein
MYDSLRLFSHERHTNRSVSQLIDRYVFYEMLSTVQPILLWFYAVLRLRDSVAF